MGRKERGGKPEDEESFLPKRREEEIVTENTFFAMSVLTSPSQINY